MNIQLKNLSWLTFAVALCVAPVYGCGDDDSSPDGGSASSVDDGGGGKGAAGKDGNDKDGGGGKGTAGKGGNGDKDGGAGKGGSDGGGTGPDAGTCEGEDGCYACAEKTTDEQFLNQCSDSQAEVFDNAKRIKYELPNGKLWKPGDDLPEVP